jgi:hypothetical protein
MESAIFGLIGVVLGAVLATAKEFLFQYQKNQKDVRYLSALVCCELEQYVVRCADVVGDDCYLDEYYRTISRVKNPKFEPLALAVEWKSLPPELMYEILDFPYKADIANRSVSDAFEHACPPVYDEGFEELRFQYATLGIAASQLVSKLRNNAGFPERKNIGESDPVKYMEQEKATIEQRRVKIAALYLQPNT